MPTNPNANLERFNEIAAVAALQQLARQLHGLSVEPSTKRFNRDRAKAGEIWSDVRELAGGRAAASTRPNPVRRKAAVRQSNSVPGASAAEPAARTA